MICIVSVIFTGDLRETIMPYLANAVYAVTDKEKLLPKRSIIVCIGTMAVLGFAVALASTLYFQYSHGMDYSASEWYSREMGKTPMDQTATRVTELSAYGQLTNTMKSHGLDIVKSMRPKGNMISWVIAGAALVILCSFMRTTFAWWPLHPVLFLVWGTNFPSWMLGFSILLGWAIKTTVVRFSGAKGYHTVKPFMSGVIAGELLGGIIWIVVGFIYYMATGLIPKAYSILGGGRWS